MKQLYLTFNKGGDNDMNFQYIGKSAVGRNISGKIEAESKEHALILLEKEGKIILKINETKPWNRDIILNKRINHKDFIIFLRQYATLIHAGIPISEATKTMIAQTTNYALTVALNDIDKKLEQGQALSKSVAAHPNVFPELLVNMIAAGEASGRLDDILNQMADYYEKEYRNKQTIISALLYPSIVGVITVIMSLILLTFVVPQFVNMIESFGESIPAYTKFVMTLSHFVISYWWVGFLLCVLGIIIYQYLLKYDRFIYRRDTFKMKIPLLGTLVQKGVLVRMTQTLSTLYNSSVPILKGVEITERVVGNKVIEEVLKESKKSLEEGESITKPMENHWAFPTLVIQMIKIGEKTGSLDSMLMKVAEFFEDEVKHLSERIKTLIEPIMIVILAVIVGGIVMAIVIPMFSLFENLQ